MWGKVPCEKGIICAKTLGRELGEKEECEAKQNCYSQEGQRDKSEEGADVSAPEFHHLRCGPASQPAPP